MGILFIIQGVLNLNSAAIFAWIQITIGLVSLFIVMYLILRRKDLTAFIKLAEAGIYFKKAILVKKYLLTQMIFEN